jgi:MFS family permease
MPPHLTRPSLSSAYLTLAVTTGIQALVSLALLTVPVLAPAAARELGFEPSLVGYFVGASYIGASFSALTAGGLVLRFGSVRVSQVCLGLCGLAMLLLTVVPLALMPAVAILLGIGYGPITPASSHVLARTTPPHMLALMFSIKQTGVPVGAALAGLLLPPLTLGLGWRPAALVVAAVCVAMAFVAQVSRRELDADRDPARRLALKSLAQPFRLIFADQALVRLVFTALAYAGLQISFFTYIVAYLMHDFAYTLVTAGLALSLANLGGIGGRIFWGWIADRTRSPGMVLGLLGLAMAVAALVTAAFGPGWPTPLILAVCLFFGVTAVGWNGVLISETARLSPVGMAGLVSGGSTFMMFLGVVFYPPSFSILHDAFASYRVPFMLFAIPATIMAVVQLVFRRRRQR